jgi:hypothetical protein
MLAHTLSSSRRPGFPSVGLDRARIAERHYLQGARSVRSNPAIGHMPSNTVHRIAPLGSSAPMRALAFAASFMPPGGSGTEAERAELPE